MIQREVVHGIAGTRTHALTNKTGTPIATAVRDTDLVDGTWELMFSKSSDAVPEYKVLVVEVGGGRRRATIQPGGSISGLIPGYTLTWGETIDDGDYATVANTAYFIANQTPPT